MLCGNLELSAIIKFQRIISCEYFYYDYWFSRSSCSKIQRDSSFLGHDYKINKDLVKTKIYSLRFFLRNGPQYSLSFSGLFTNEVT